MGATHPTRPAVLKNQSGNALQARAYSTGALRCHAQTTGTTDGDCLECPPCESEHAVPKFGSLQLEAESCGNNVLVAVRVSPSHHGDIGSAQLCQARVVAVEAGIEMCVNVDSSGELAFRVFRRPLHVEGGDTEGGRWDVIPSKRGMWLSSSQREIHQPAPISKAAVSQPFPHLPSALNQPTIQCSKSPGVAQKSVANVDDAEGGLYLSEAQWDAGVVGPLVEDTGSHACWDDDAAEDGDDGEVLQPPPKECLCPISHELFVDPVFAADGFTYERRCIEDLFRKGSGGQAFPSPLTRRPLDNFRLIPNLAIRDICQQYRALSRKRSNGMSCSSTQAQANERGTDVNALDCPGADSTRWGGSFEAHLPALVKRFPNVDTTQIRDVCASFSEESVLDVEVIAGQLQSFSNERPSLMPAEKDGMTSNIWTRKGMPVAGLPLTAVSIETANEEMAAPELKDWPAKVGDMYRELVQVAEIHPVAAMKAITVGRAETFEEAVEWLATHQDDEDFLVPEDELREREESRLILAVMRIATLRDPKDRMDCYVTLHSIFKRILDDPENARVRKIRQRNPQFHKCVGRFKPARLLLKLTGFKIGEFWSSHQDREPCVEFTLPVDSDNPFSLRFVRVYSILDEIVNCPEAWPGLLDARPGDSDDRPSSAPAKKKRVQPSLAARLTESNHIADLHEWRARDPRGFREAMVAAGKTGNRVVVNVTKQHEPPAPRLAEQQDGYQNLQERFGGRREFNLQDIEQMRVDDAIRGATLYAEEYQNQRNAEATSTGRDSYSALRNRYYDVQYLGRVCVDRTNAFRAENRLPPLKWNQGIADIAEEHARQMARGEMPFSHLDFDKRVARYPFPHAGAGENLAYNGGHADVAVTAVKGWIDSPGHRKNLLGTWNLCGVGVAQSSGGMFYFTQLFARTSAPLA
eukprot:TRINITY_DN33419_c0_g1_i1.p1 TRINITY_DN33419_c0_g1~~TRINITY_DN33419_c0_g1_i1.p1  ORF type:complete len:922 (-),score=110.19 TRINITY_DN33419_c0_g1_i1:118-2883(-)